MLKAEAKFHEYDCPHFQEIQTDIAKHLLKLRISFLENQRIDKKYRTDIKLLKKNIAIIIRADDDSNLRETKPYKGIENLKDEWFKKEASEKLRIQYIDADKWQTLDEMAKLKLLTLLTA